MASPILHLFSSVPNAISFSKVRRLQYLSFPFIFTLTLTDMRFVLLPTRLLNNIGSSGSCDMDNTKYKQNTVEAQLTDL